MALMQWPVAVIAAVVLLVVVVCAALWPLERNRQRPRGAVPLDHLERLRALPRYRALVASHLRRHLLQTVCAIVAAVCLVVLVGRPVQHSMNWSQHRNRDVVLCLDVSGSMSEVDGDVISAYRSLARNLNGDRIGLVAFDSAAVTVFPLTDDADYVDTELAQFSRDLDRGPVPGTRAGSNGSSLIGDGLTSCLQRFDGSGNDGRGRTVVLATDNQLSGTPLFSLNDAVRAAVSKHVMVQGVAPSESDATAVSVLHDAVTTTGGDVTLVTGTSLEDPQRIIRAVNEQEARSTDASASWTQSDFVWPFVAVALVALVAASVLGRAPFRGRGRSSDDSQS